jgi:hypothetical protein
MVEDVAKDRTRDGRVGGKGQDRRWLKMWVKTGQEDGRGGGKGQD